MIITKFLLYLGNTYAQKRERERERERDCRFSQILTLGMTGNLKENGLIKVKIHGAYHELIYKHEWMVERVTNK